MIINKIIPGFVIQTFDTERGAFTHQEFVESTQAVQFEDADANPVDDDTVGSLDTEMVQPL